MRQEEINKMIELLKNNPTWLHGDTRNCTPCISRHSPCIECPIYSKRTGGRIYTRGTTYCGDSFRVKLKRMKEEDKLEILTAVLGG
jgi:hypothetical protein